MKKTLFALALLSAYATHAQEKIIYLDEDGKTVKEKKAVILEQQVKLNDTLWEVNTYSNNGPRSTSKQFSDEKGKVLNGRYIAYDRKGFCDTVGTYVYGHKEGPWRIINQKGRTLRALIFDNDKLVAKKDSTQLNEEEEKLKDSLWHGRTIVESESEFPGGAAAWMQYMNTHLKYPDRAFNNDVQGTSSITFRVEQDGHVDPVFTYVDRSVEYSIDQESLKLIAGCPLWTPAMQDGKQVRSYKRQPVVFTFSKK
ncbi:MAG TPA: energy transducer TonB [Puia sp.]|jgi:protein TonB